LIDIKTRFLKYTSSCPTGCLLWIGGKSSSGYGIFTIKHKPYLAHRISYGLFNGEVPQDQYVCHKCDNKLCVNPDHLFLGSASDNMQDMIAKGRGNKRKGEAHVNSKLDWDKVKEIRSYIGQRGMGVALARKFGVSGAVITEVQKNRTWCS
jgi:hypothetical protein